MGGGNYAENAIPHYPLIDVSRFLLAALNIDAILREPTMYRRRERLNEIADGSGLRDAYGATIERIRSLGGGKSRLGMEAMMWISHAERPLRADELCHALAVEQGSKEFNVENIPSMSTLISCCQGLITVDKEASTVRLIHFTLREYLSAHPDIFTRAHSAMAEICLTYLNSKQVKALSAALPSYIRNTPFLEYCSLYRGAHAKRELSDCPKSLALELLHNYGGHVSAKTLLSQARYPGYGMLGTSSHLSGLHCTSFFGIVEVVAALIGMDSYDINERDRLGRTPLACAAENGHVGVVNILLLQSGVNPDKPDIYNYTPLLRPQGCIAWHVYRARGELGVAVMKAGNFWGGEDGSRRRGLKISSYFTTVFYLKIPEGLASMPHSIREGIDRKG